jgi:hypothetical protein
MSWEIKVSPSRDNVRVGSAVATWTDVSLPQFTFCRNLEITEEGVSSFLADAQAGLDRFREEKTADINKEYMVAECKLHFSAEMTKVANREASTSKFSSAEVDSFISAIKPAVAVEKVE